MKRLLIVSLYLCSMIGGAFAAERSMLARVTVYWASGGSGSDGWTRRHIAASGARLRNGHCAVDPRRIPYGSKVRMADGTLTAVDTGSAVRTRRAARQSGRSPIERNAIVIDRFFETKAEALAWARRNPRFMKIQVAAPNESLVTQTTTTVTKTTTTVTPSLASRVSTATTTTRRSAMVPAPQTLRSRNFLSVPRSEPPAATATTRRVAGMLVGAAGSTAPKFAANDSMHSPQ